MSSGKINLGKVTKAGLYAAIIPLSVIPNPAGAMLTIVVSGTVDLNFGTVTESGAGGTVTINTAGARTVGGAVTAITGGGLESQGMISVSGSTGLAIDLSITAAPFAITDGGANNMNVGTFNLVTNGGGSDETVTLTSNPTSYPYGATLTVGAGQAAGTYNGTFTINAAYQ